MVCSKLIAARLDLLIQKTGIVLDAIELKMSQPAIWGIAKFFVLEWNERRFPSSGSHFDGIFNSKAALVGVCDDKK